MSDLVNAQPNTEAGMVSQPDTVQTEIVQPQQQQAVAMQPTEAPAETNDANELVDLYAADVQMAPESYDFSSVVDENGNQYNEQTLKLISNIARSMNMSNEQAIEFLNKTVPAYNEARNQELLSQRKTWRQELMNDQELGGKNFDRTRLNLSTVLRKFGNNEVKEIFNKTGIGDHPAFVRMFNAIGASLNQDNQVVKGETPKPKFTFENYYYNTKL